MSIGPTIALFPEASFGAALNCVGIARALKARGARPVFICHAGFSGVFAEYGFQEYHLPLADAPVPETYWQDFISRHQPHFNLDPADQIETYVAPTWDAIVETAEQAEAPLFALLQRLRPDAVVLDNVVMFPAIVRAGCPWVRVISCAETELPDPNVPPYLSGLPADDRLHWQTFVERYNSAVGPVHHRYNKFRSRHGLPPLDQGQFLEPSPWHNLLLAPSVLRYDRQHQLDPARFTFLEGCVRQEAPYQVPEFAAGEGPLIYVSFGSLGALDTELIKRLIVVFAEFPARFLVNVGAFRDAYRAVPDNVILDQWFPQPSVVAEADLFIHHGGNNSFCEALYYGVPSLIMPYCWDGHDNARRAVETGTGRRLHRAHWTADELTAAMQSALEDREMCGRLKDNESRMVPENGVDLAAERIVEAARQGAVKSAPLIRLPGAD
ncbi:glycosyltransferase [Defluviimonas sp. WL0050]|uniref:Glycosyltransferase n=1 Tax=Albidovulum litorale TaxID=2984134 RepID=A0ABT2ZNJ9_9RHOB|nr:glycosyltransferase [Defluviimonas sp. WL0050]MCV2872713.1 glycosyltransferase [Defluviimonas sp. WL0050]